MEEFEKVIMEFMKILNERLEKQWRLDQERYEKWNERLKKCLKKEQGNANSFLPDSLIDSIGKFKYNPE